MKGKEGGEEEILRGLAIPRPTGFPPALAGLGDPRNSIKSFVLCIRLSLMRHGGKLLGPLQFYEFSTTLNIGSLSFLF